MSKRFPIALALTFAAWAPGLQFPFATSPASIEITAPASQADVKTSCLGDDACRSCHEQKVHSFHATAHYLTSRLPDSSSISGNFSPGNNVMKTSNPELFFRMEAKDSKFFETAVEGADPYFTTRTEQIAFVIGSGGKGQTYLFWKGDQLFELPVSYWKELGWVNSPGYRDGTANFNRPIIPRCLDCHGTYFETNPPPPNRYRQGGSIVGITCEKCHGPGAQHAQHYQAKSTANADPAILNPARFSRERQMDLCAWCHAGQGEALAPVFSYVPGTPLREYLRLPEPDPAAPLDVHGSQVELLKKSRCYQSSEMTCLTCHDVHESQHDLAAFSDRCLSCHKPQSSAFPKHGLKRGGNCIDCHMPLQETELIVFDQNGRKEKPKVRNHWITVYPHTPVAAQH